MYKILIVDDDRALTLALSIRLKAQGFNVLICNSAEQASTVALHDRPDAIILDIDLPCCTGYEFHQCLQIARRTRHIPVIYLSGYDTETNRRMAVEQGASAFVRKPYEAGELIRLLRGILEETGEAVA